MLVNLSLKLRKLVLYAVADVDYYGCDDVVVDYVHLLQQHNLLKQALNERVISN